MGDEMEVEWSEPSNNPPPFFLQPAGDQSAAAISLLQLRDWSSLTGLPLVSIMRRLDTIEDLFSFRRVCWSWRAVSAPTPDLLPCQHPLLVVTVMPSEAEALYDIIRGRLYGARLPWSVSSEYFSIFCAYGYLVTSTIDGVGDKLLLWDILTKAKISLPKIPKQFERVLLSSNPGAPGCLVLLFKCMSPLILQYLHIGNSGWTVVDCSKSRLRHLRDMIFFKDKLYALTLWTQLVEVDLAAGPKYKVLGRGKGSTIDQAEYEDVWLAVSGEELLAVCHKFEEDDGLGVFRWDFESNGWKVKHTLGGRALFMNNEGFAGSVAASEVGVRGDCIYFLTDQEGLCFVFSLEDQTTMVASPALSALPIFPDPVNLVWVLPSTF